MEQQRFAGAGIPDPGFAGDSGAVPPEVAAALRSYAADPTGYAVALAILQSSRLLVPVVALPREVAEDASGLANDKSSEMAAVLLTGADGRRALLAFTGTDPMSRWRLDARPVPVTTRDAGRAAVQEGAAALVVDVAGPVTFVIEGDDLVGLAEGWRLVRLGGRTGWMRPGD